MREVSVGAKMVSVIKDAITSAQMNSDGHEA